MTATWPWAVLALLGAYHGLNPAMGWLFALALGLQEKRRSAVFAALNPIGVGHAAAIAITILLFHFLQQMIPIHALKWIVAAILFALGIYRLFRASHPRGAGMRVNQWDLSVWSFLMATAHGAGLMIVPVLLSQSAHAMGHHMHEATPGNAPEMSVLIILLAVLVHTAAMLVVAGILAAVFYQGYERWGLGVLRHAWLNFDLIWALALLVAGVAALWP
jgi:hypothetical protein